MSSDDAQNAAARSTPAVETVAPQHSAGTPEIHIGKLTKYPNEEFNASIVQILSHRDRYHGKRVQIEGYLLVRFEGTSIYLSKEDAVYGMTRNGFWVSFDKRAVPYDGIAGPVQFHRKYVLIEGTFDKDNMGHMSLWQGAIENVDRVLELTKNE